jgi:hypothetical protein
MHLVSRFVFDRGKYLRGVLVDLVGYLMGKSIYPTFHQALSTPGMSLQEWSSFVCPTCKVRLRLKPTSRPICLILLGISFAQLGNPHLVPRWLGLLLIFVGSMFFFAAAVFLILEYRRPKLQLKKPLPKPEFSLNLSNY